MNYPKVNNRFKTKVSCSGGGKVHYYIREDVVNKQMRAKDREIERLKKLVKTAYEEGYLNHGYPDGLKFHWNYSDTKEILRKKV